MEITVKNFRGCAEAHLTLEPVALVCGTNGAGKSSIAQAVAAALGREAIAPRVLRLDPDAAGGYARDLEILPNTLPPEKHLGYAVQWFGLALTVLVTALILTFRRRRAHSGNHRHSRHP